MAVPRSRLTLLAAEINVVVSYRLWPRSMTQPPFTPQDKTAMVLLAKMEERRPEETVDVNFTPEADRQPLDEPSQTPGPHDGGEPLPEHPPEHETGSPERAV